jgi:hypothetical protein
MSTVLVERRNGASVPADRTRNFAAAVKLLGVKGELTERLQKGKHTVHYNVVGTLESKFAENI